MELNKLFAFFSRVEKEEPELTSFLQFMREQWTDKPPENMNAKAMAEVTFAMMDDIVQHGWEAALFDDGVVRFLSKHTNEEIFRMKQDFKRVVNVASEFLSKA